MTSHFNVPRSPALLIGLGGSGVRALRFVRWLAARGDDPELRALVDSGAIKLVAIDTDLGANAPVEVDDYVLPRPKTWRAAKETEQRHLPPLDTVFHVRTDDIVRAFDNARRSRRRSYLAATDGDALSEALPPSAKLPAVPDALLRIPRDELEEMTLGQAREGGAGQWRLLGRVGLFTRISEIFATVQEAYKHVRDATPAKRRVRVYIICSLGGGTGSGMFMDIAHLMRLTDPHCYVIGCFLLAESFRGLDTVGRIEPNVYAALKEIAVYKNWRLKSGVRLTVDYPIGEKGVKFEAEAGSDSSFNAVYVYQGFATTSETGASDGIHGSKLQLTALRMAENVLAQLRQDLHDALEGAENVKSDSATRSSQDERGYVFSTSAYVPFGITGADTLVDTLRAAFIMRLQRLTYDGRERLPRRTLCRWLAGAPDTGLPPVSGAGRLDFLDCLANATDDCPDLATMWRNGVSRQVPQQPQFVAEATAKLAELQEKARQLGGREWRTQPAKRAELARELYAEHVDQRLRDGWKAVITGNGEGWRKNGVVTHLSEIDLFERDLDRLWEPLGKRLEALRNHMAEKLVTLDSDAERWLRAAADALHKHIGHPDPGLVINNLAVTAPASLVQMRAELDIVKADRDDRLAQWQSAYGGGAIDRILKVFASRLHITISNLATADRWRDRWTDIVRGYLQRKAGAMKEQIDAVLRTNEEIDRRLLDRSKEISRYGFTWLTDVYNGYEQAAEDFEVLMDPLEKTLDALFHPHDDDPLKAAIESLMDMTMNAAQRSALQNLDAFEKDEERRGGWRRLLEEVKRELQARARLAQRNHTAEPLVEVLAKLLEKYWLAPAGYLKVLKDPEELKKYLIGTEVYATGFVRFWSEQPNFVMARLGGMAGLVRTIERCRSSVFGGGTVRQTIQRSRLVIGLPRMADLSDGARRGGLPGDLKHQIAVAAQRVLNVPPTFTKAPSAIPYVYYEELYRAGAEILEIAQYHRSYMAFEERLRTLFHIDREAVDFDNLIDSDGPAGTVLCGNPRCSHNIAHLDRRTLLCPGCGEPIRNRCGNADCPADDLAEQIPVAVLDAHLRPTPSRCPRCRGELRTYWWRCPEPRHAKEWIPTHDKLCPQCRDEYTAGIRPYAEVRRVDPDVRIDCPGCLSLRLPVDQRVRILPELRGFFESGVPPAAQPQFLRLIDRHDLDPHYCVNSDKGEHMLFPTADLIVNGRMQRVFLHREASRFVGDIGEPSVEESCYHCGYPIDPTAVEMMRAGRPLTCPRCLRTLEECPYCSHHDHKLFSPTSVGGVERCPRCTNRITREIETFSRVSADGLRRAGFCRNLFGCRAGSHPWGSAADFTRERCGACSGGKEEDASLLLRYEDLSTHVERCPLCLTLLGMPKGSRVEGFSPRQLAQHFLHRGADDLQDACAICGTQPAAVLQWMTSNDYFKDVSIEEIPERDIAALRHTSAGAYAIPALAAKDGIDILNALLTMESADDLFRTIMELPVFRNRSVALPTAIQELERLFVGRSISPRTVRQRLEKLEKMFEEISAREVERHLEPAF